MFKQLLNRFFNALTFYSRVPGPNWVDYSDDQLNRASGFFPLIGYLVALWCFAIFWLLEPQLGIEISLLISMGAGILITGAFHEDGFADLCDGFGGGFTVKDTLRIMKDSRLGTYGVCGLIFILALKYLTLLELSPEYLLLSLFIAHSLSRAWAISLIMVLPYVQLDEQSKAKPIAKQWFKQDMALAWFFALIPLCFIPFIHGLILFATGGGCFIATIYWYKRKLAGYTGDALGASQQIQEVLIYLILIGLLV